MLKAKVGLSEQSLISLCMLANSGLSAVDAAEGLCQYGQIFVNLLKDTNIWPGGSFPEL